MNIVAVGRPSDNLSRSPSQFAYFVSQGRGRYF